MRSVGSLAEAVAVALGESPGGRPAVPPESVSERGLDLSEVRGQPLARRALEVAAAGGHHLLLWGPPGSGKTMLARCLPGLLPELAEEEGLEVAQVWSAAGRRIASRMRPPYRAPHHSASMAAMVGGGSGIPVPGEVSLAHRGVLFLDELGEFPVSILDAALRQPLEAGHIAVARKGASVTFPSDVQLVAATNPCPCGYAGDRQRGCSCTERAVERYRRRLSGPLMDRFDLRVAVGRPEGGGLVGPPEEPSDDVKKRVEAARARQATRGRLNRSLSGPELHGFVWDPHGLDMLLSSVDRLRLTARGFDRIRRVARTVADLDGSEYIRADHLAEALSFRGDW